MDQWVTFAIALSGMIVWRLRLRSALRTPDSRKTAELLSVPRPDVSIIVPARNEASNLPALLRSLLALDPPAREIIVVDDHSTDGTGELARCLGVTVVTPAPLPENWNGKPWACQAGADVATGSLLLFTDADTVHAPDSLARVAKEQSRGGAALVSVIPTHLAVRGWERLQGVFHILLLIATGAGARNASGERRFAIGQYILISRSAYQSIAGHRSVARRIAEDLGLARAVADTGATVSTLFAPRLMQVRMYPTGLRAFISGWRRSFFEGMGAAGLLASFEIALVMGWLLGAPILIIRSGLAAQWSGLATGLLLYGLAVIAVARSQAVLGAFSPRSALAYPVFALLFCWISALAVLDRARGKRPTWKGRQILSDTNEVAP